MDAQTLWRCAQEQFRSEKAPYRMNPRIAAAGLEAYDGSRNLFVIAARSDADRDWLQERHRCLQRVLACVTRQAAHVEIISRGEQTRDPGNPAQNPILAGNLKRMREQFSDPLFWERLGVPAGFASAALSDLNPQSAIRRNAAVRQYLDSSSQDNLILSGPPGTGKTTLAVCLLKDTLETGRTVLFVDARDLIQRMQADFHTGNSSGLKLFDRACGVEFLVLDDFNIRGLSEWASLQLGDLFRWRSHHPGHAFILTTNQDRRELVGSPLLKQTLSRLLAGSTFVALPPDAPDLRLARRMQKG